MKLLDILGTGYVTYMFCLIFMVNVGKYTVRPMDGKGKPNKDLNSQLLPVVTPWRSPLNGGHVKFKGQGRVYP